jgi:DNA-directed RNA polymerase subunit RPC12/RpoP
MSGRLRCPKCGKAVAEAGPGRPLACPACGAKLTSKHPPRPARGEDAAGPRKGKRARQPAATALPVPIWVIPVAAGALLAVVTTVAVGAWLLRAGRAKPRPDVAAGGAGGGGEAVIDPVEPPAPPAATFPPVPWAVPPGGAAAGAPVADVIDLLDVGADHRVHLFPGSRDRYMTPVLRPDPANPGGTFRYQLGFGRFDPATGKPVGKPDLVLGPDYMADNAPGKADVAPDGTLAAMAVNGRTAETVGVIIVFAPADKEPRKLPPATQSAKWLGWSAAGRLLVLKDGKLAAWEPAGGKPVFEVGEKLTEPVALSPARNWVVVCVDGKYLEVRDAATGDVRGRLGGEADWRGLDVAPDGKRLAGVRFPPLPTGSPVGTPYDVELHVWDLTTGERTARLKDAVPGLVSWAGPNHLYHAERVFDIELGLAVVTLGLPEPPFGIAPVRSPDGRLWWSGRNGQAFPAAIPTAPAGGGRLAFTKGTPVRLALSCSDARREAPARAALTKQLTAFGHPVGESQWLVKVKAEEYDIGHTLFVTGQQKTVSEPGVKGEMKLIAPDGTAVATSPVGGRFPERQSKYFVRERRDQTNPMGYILEYDFRGADPRRAMLDEVWGQFVRFPAA